MPDRPEMKLKAHRLLALSQIAYQDDDRPHLSQIRFHAEGFVSATNGHWLAIVDLEEKPTKDFGIDARIVGDMFAHVPEQASVVVRHDDATQRVHLDLAWPQPELDDPDNLVVRQLRAPAPFTVTLPLPKEMESYPPVEQVLPTAFRNKGWVDPAHCKVASFAIAAKYLDGVMRFRDSFIPMSTGFYLLAGGGADPVLWGYRWEDGRRVLLCVMPMVDRGTTLKVVKP